MNWYVRNADERVFGPVDDATLVAWAKDGRIEPFAGISNDLKFWKLASLVPMLEMDWIVENEPGRFYGPTHRAVIDDLIRTKSLSDTCRIYRDDHDGSAERDISKLRKEAEAAMAELKDEADRAIAEATSAAESARNEAESARNEVAAMRKRAEASEAKVAELEAKIAKLTEVKKREWTADVMEPEIVSETPPPKVHEMFKGERNSTLAQLERQAQAELARMGASEAKRFFRMKR